MEPILHNQTQSAVGQCLQDTGFKLGKEFLSLFYIMSPNETTWDSAYDVPDYEVTLVPVFGVLLLIETILRYFQRKDVFRVADLVVNMGSATIFILMRVFLLTSSIIVLNWMHTHCKVVDLPVHSVWTWLLSLLLVEFTYYWIHRALHEFNILWAAHQFHHMAEDINVSTTVRDSVVDLFIYAVFPIPLAVVIPPPILLVHVQFSLIYQIWLHNSVIGHLGPFEYLMINTPRQHRVHHGRNPYCIDKNYGALLMIFDRLFGTYQAEKDKIVFGVVSPTPNTFDQLTLQFGYYRDVWNKFKKVEGCGNKMAALLKGPGWMPGKPRLGLISDVPEPDHSAPKYNYDPVVPEWKKWYAGVHMLIFSLQFYLLADHPHIRFSSVNILLAISYSVFMFTSFGAIFDNRKMAPILEMGRCVTYFAFDYFLIEQHKTEFNLGPTMLFMLELMLWTLRAVHLVSINFWLLQCCMQWSGGHNDNTVMEDTDSTDTAKASDKESGKVVGASRGTPCRLPAVVAFLVMAAIPFIVAMMARVQSCHVMFNQLPLHR